MCACCDCNSSCQKSVESNNSHGDHKAVEHVLENRRAVLPISSNILKYGPNCLGFKLIFFSVPIKLWALSVVATLSLLKSIPARNFAKNLESFKMEATSKRTENKPNQHQNKQKPTTETSKYSRGGKRVKHYALCRIAGRFAAVKDAYSSFFSQQCPINVHLLPDVAIVAGLQVIEVCSE